MNKYLTTIFSGKTSDEFIEIRFGMKNLPPNQQAWFTDIQEAVAFAEKISNDHNIFFGVNPRKIKNGNRENISDTINWVFVDLDSKSLTEIQKTKIAEKVKSTNPNIIVNSGGGYHLYWKISPCNKDEFESIQTRLISYFGSDPAVKDAPRIMRLPGSFNQKYAPVRSVGYKIKHENINDLNWLPKSLPLHQAQSFQKHLDIEEALASMTHGNRNPILASVAGKCFGRGDSLETVKLAIFTYMDAHSKWTDNKQQEKINLDRDLDRWYSNWYKDKDKGVLTAEKKASLLKDAYKATTESDMLKVGQNIINNVISKKEEFIFEAPKLLSEVLLSRKEYRLGSPELDNPPLFASSTTTIIAGASGSGKTTVAMNIAKALIASNNVDVLYINSKSENSDEDLYTNLHSVGVPLDKIKVIKFPRVDNPYDYFKKMLNDYKQNFGKYPEVVFIDTIEKMFSDSSNVHIKRNSEDIAAISNEIPSCFILLSQLSSPEQKANARKKMGKHITYFMQQGGTDVVNNIGNWMSIERIIDPYTGTKIKFYFSKLRSKEVNQKLYSKAFYADIKQDTLEIDFFGLMEEQIEDFGGAK